MFGERGSLLLRVITTAFVALWDFIFFCSSASVSWVLGFLPLRMEIPNCSSEFSSTEVASLVKKALDLTEFDDNSSEFVDDDDDDDDDMETNQVDMETNEMKEVKTNRVDDIETDQVERSADTLAHDHENPVKHFDHQKETMNSQWPLTANRITPDRVSEIEKELDFYEKIALVFLLYDNEDLALQRIKVAKKSNRIGLISDWARVESSTNPLWHNKFLEALCIIQNYKLIRKLGFSREDVDLRFLPNNFETSHYVHIVRKVLYILCESLDHDQSLQLLNYLKTKLMESGHAPKDFWAFDPDLMEIALLQMMSLRFLNVGINNTDIDAAGLVCGLKAVGVPQLAENLKSLCSRKSDDSLSAASDTMSYMSSSTSSSELKTEISAVLSDDGFKYEINPKHVGFCIIINQKVFTRDTTPHFKHLLPEDHLETRVGTDLDRDRLIEIFTKLGFLVRVRENLTNVKIEDEVKKAGNALVQSYHSCFALCILSHGKKNIVYGSNSLPVYVENIENMLHGSQCKNLFRKPKILIIQACQGTTRQQALPYVDVVTDGPGTKTAPEVGDMITFWSTVPGYAAFRDKVRGSWFVKSLWNEMMSEGSQRDLTKIFTRVIGRVSELHANFEGEKKAMMPTYNTTLRRDLIFPCLPDFNAEAARRVIERVMYYKLVYEFADFYLANRRR